ncbi:hypothetical protein [Flavobacterium praedii]|nr:hypothetical protein [Flavobacterium praedii]
MKFTIAISIAIAIEISIDIAVFIAIEIDSFYNCLIVTLKLSLSHNYTT